MDPSGIQRCAGLARGRHDGHDGELPSLLVNAHHRTGQRQRGDRAPGDHDGRRDSPDAFLDLLLTDGPPTLQIPVDPAQEPLGSVDRRERPRRGLVVDVGPPLRRAPCTEQHPHARATTGRQPRVEHVE
jgi:hypothetical protein